MNSIAITGASSGMGAALAVELARPGVAMLLVARRVEALERTAAAARAKGAQVEVAAADVTDGARLAAALTGFDDAHPIDLIVANAGVAYGRDAATKLEKPASVRRMVDVNLSGMLNTVEPLLPRFLARRSGRIALVSSIAARRPSADEPTYSATKAAVRAYGEAMRSWLRGEGVTVTVICPGFVTTEMSSHHDGPQPFAISAEKAAALMAGAIRRGRGRYTFPWPWAFLLWWEQFLPARFSDWFERRHAADIRSEE